jgi:hypothetical protein
MGSPFVLRSHPTNIFLAKFWGPLLCIGATVGVFGKDFLTWRFLFASPFIMAALFGATITILEVRDGVLRYRRFFKWTTIRDDEIVAAGVVWHPFIGWLRLNRFIFPWGTLYFALDANLNANPFRRGDYPLLRHLKKVPVPSETQSGTGGPGLARGRP